MIDSINFEDLFYYDETSYSCIRIKHQWHYNAKPVDSEVGSVSGDYFTVYVCGKSYFVHRIVYEMHHGKIPVGHVIDHINGNPKDNTITNLRLCKQSDNVKNTKISKNNTSGYKGVYWDKSNSKWKSQIRSNGKKITLGYFNTAYDAHLAYEDKATELFGEYKRGSV